MSGVLRMFSRSAGRQPAVAGTCPPATTVISSGSRPQVEPDVTVGGRSLTDAARTTAHLLGDPCHYGSADLETFPPSAAELEAAAVGDFRWLAEVCGSFPRARAVMSEVERPEREAAADRLLARLR